MSTYVSLIEYTRDGIQNIGDGPDRLQDAKDRARSLGGEVTDFYLTFGRYDVVLVSEFPDDESYAQFVLGEARQGAVSTETLKAFPEDEYAEVIAGIPE